MDTLLTEAEEKRYAELQALALDLARTGETEPLQSMLQAGLPPNLSDHKGNTLLMLAGYHGHVDTARMLLRSGADVDRRNDRGQTPLGGAAFKGDTDIVLLLLDHGADPDADNGGGMTPIMFASMFGRFAVVDQLRAHGASMKLRNRLGIPAAWMVAASRVLHRFLRTAARIVQPRPVPGR